MRFAVLLAVLAPVAATAEPWACSFTQECAGGACTARETLIDIVPAEDTGQPVFRYGTHFDRAMRVEVGGASGYVTIGTDTPIMLTVFPGGAATARVDLRDTGGSRAVTLNGSCRPL